MGNYIYIDPRNGRYIVRQGRNTYGRFHNKKEAIKLRDKLLHDGTIKPKRSGPPYKNTESRYIYLKQGKYRIYKRLHGKVEGFGTFHTLEDAREERDFLESIDWDYDNMETIENIEYQENKEQWRRAINE